MDDVQYLRFITTWLFSFFLSVSLATNSIWYSYQKKPPKTARSLENFRSVVGIFFFSFGSLLLCFALLFTFYSFFFGFDIPSLSYVEFLD